MFKFFSRKRISDWELILLRNVIKKLPSDYHELIDQIEEGLLDKVIPGIGDFPNYIGFTYNRELIDKFEKVNEKDFKITGIKVFNSSINKFIKFELYVLSGTISGYSLKKKKRDKIDVDRICIKTPIKKYLYNSQDSIIDNLLNYEERQCINLDNVYKVEIDNMEYYHVKDLEDGDFIGMNKQKNIYKITHDPFEIIKIEQSLLEILNSNDFTTF